MFLYSYYCLNNVIIVRRIISTFLNFTVYSLFHCFLNDTFYLEVRPGLDAVFQTRRIEFNDLSLCEVQCRNQFGTADLI